MDKSIQAQRDYWSSWNSTNRESHVSDTGVDQREVILRWLQRLGRTDLDIIEVGCGTGWLCPSLANFGKVTGTDLCDEVISRAQERMSEISSSPAISCRSTFLMRLLT